MPIHFPTLPPAAPRYTRAAAMLAALVFAGAAPLAGQEVIIRADAARELAGLARLEGLAALRGLQGLEGLRALQEPRALQELQGLEALRELQAPRALQGVQELHALHGLHALRGLEGLRALEGVQALRAIPDDGAPYDPVTQTDQDRGVDSLYRTARDRMNRGDYKGAAELFQQVTRRAVSSALAGDALYWHAFSLFRIGGSSELNTALASLDRLARDYPRAAVAGDASTLRIRVCGELAQRGDAACAAQVTDRAGSGQNTTASAGNDQQQACSREDDDERVAALNALLQMDAERALPVLERVLARRDRCSTSLRRKAVFLVSQKGQARAAEILMNAVRNDPDAEVREQAVFWLGQTRDDRAVDMLQEILQRETSGAVLDKAVFALSQHRSSRASTILRDLAQRDGAPLRQREQAIFWLGQQRNSENAELLRTLYRRVNEEGLKEKIIFALSQHQGDGNGKWLLDVATDERESIAMRKKALFWAGQSRTTSMADLGALYDRVTNREMREQIIFVYSQRRDPAAIDKLLDIARNEKDRELRKKAIFWLSQSRDPRVVKFLEEIIG